MIEQQLLSIMQRIKASSDAGKIDRKLVSAFTHLYSRAGMLAQGEYHHLWSEWLKGGVSGKQGYEVREGPRGTVEAFYNGELLERSTIAENVALTMAGHAAKRGALDEFAER